MTIRRQADLFVILIVAVLVGLGGVGFYQQRLVATVVRTTTTLDRIKHIAHRLEIDILAGRADTDAIDRLTSPLPALFQELRQQEFVAAKASYQKFVDLGVAFVRIKRAAQPLEAGSPRPAILVEQLHNEVRRIEAAVETIRERVRQHNEQRIARLRYLGNALYPMAFVLVLLGLYGIRRSVLMPLLALARQVDAMQQGRRQNIEIQTQENEIGELARFTNDVITYMRDQYRELADKQQELAGALQKKEAISEILQLHLETSSLDEILVDTIKIIVNLDWIGLENKGAIFLVDQDAERSLALAAHVNFPIVLQKTCANIPFDHCICGRCASSRRLLHASHCDHRHQVVFSQMGDHGHYAIPILFRDTLLGVMILYLPAGHPENASEVQFLTDVSNLLAATIARRQLEERQRLIATAVDQAGEGIAISDRQGRIRYANSVAAALVNKDLDELYRNTIDQLVVGIHGNDYSALISAFQKAGEWFGEAHCGGNAVGHFTDKLAVSPIRHPEFGATHFLVIRKDVSDEENLRQQLMHSQKMESIGRLAGGVAHDFNNIIASILGFAELTLRSPDLHESLRDHIEIVITSARKAAALTRQLLAFSRRQLLETQLLDLADIVQHLGKMLRRLIGENIELHIATPEEGVPVQGDPGQLEQVIMNLAVNARDAMPNGGRLTIKVAIVEAREEGQIPAGQYALLQVTDSGHGIPPEIREQIFEPFFTTKGVGSGTGLGLATVYGIVKQHQGYISVASKVGSGSVFSLYFPLAAGDPATEAAAHATPIAGTESILVVDDDLVIGRMIADALSSLGYTVFVAPDAAGAGDIANNHSIDLLLTDLVLPDENGQLLAQRLRARHPAIKVLFMSGYPEEDLAQHGVALAGATFMRKPVTLSELTGKIRQALDGS